MSHTKLLWAGEQLAVAQDDWQGFQLCYRVVEIFYLKWFTANLLSNAGATDLVWVSRNCLMRFLSLLKEDTVSIILQTSNFCLYCGFSWYSGRSFQYDFLLAADAEDIFLFTFAYLSSTDASTALPRIFHHKILNTQIPFSFARYIERKPTVDKI